MSPTGSIVYFALICPCSSFLALPWSTSVVSSAGNRDAAIWSTTATASPDVCRRVTGIVGTHRTPISAEQHLYHRSRRSLCALQGVERPEEGGGEDEIEGEHASSSEHPSPDQAGLQDAADVADGADEVADSVADTAQARESRAENMELRDFRARLMSKGLDGWGAEGERVEGKGEGSGNSAAATASHDRWAHPLVRPELGCLVMAHEKMYTERQQYFYRAVILVIQHGEDGTVGLILNRPTNFNMGDVCKGDLYRVPGLEDNVLYMGGDVAGARDDGLDVVNLMHGRDDVPGIEVVKGLRLGGLKEALYLVAEGKADPEDFKFFSRYSGWGPGQLEAEVLAGDWTLAACDLPSVLQNHNHPDQPGHFWSDITSRIRRHRNREDEQASGT